MLLTYSLKTINYIIVGGLNELAHNFKAVVQLINPAIHFVEPAIHFVEPTINLVEPSIVLIKPTINLVEAIIHITAKFLKCLSCFIVHRSNLLYLPPFCFMGARLHNV